MVVSQYLSQPRMSTLEVCVCLIATLHMPVTSDLHAYTMTSTTSSFFAALSGICDH